MSTLSSSADRVTPDDAARSYLSSARLDPYVQHCAGDTHAALKLYQWNATLSGAFWVDLGHVEVILRNALAQRLQYRYDHAHPGTTGSWIDDPAAIGLDSRGIKDVREAKERLARKHKAHTQGQVIAELNFGFWRFLFAKTYNTTLWPDLSRAFPHSGPNKRPDLEQIMIRLHKLRNRIAHHEPIWANPTQRHHDDALALVGYISPDLRDWINQASTVPHTLTQRPTQPQGTA